ncbi:hypothetical protein QQF64_024451 [Cirrhinus molitorella]|uniref:Uncharacterized protein n=1 Tax=Cirrhinus molitorella TaxID=172907 RepID=A0ABR3NM67_9TELE
MALSGSVTVFNAYLSETPRPWRTISNPAASLGVTVNPHEPRWQQDQGMSRLPEMKESWRERNRQGQSQLQLPCGELPLMP